MCNIMLLMFINQQSIEYWMYLIGLLSAKPIDTITKFFQLSPKTLKSKPSIFWHCENVPANSHFTAKKPCSPCILQLFHRHFHKQFFPIFWNPWRIRAHNIVWKLFPFFRDYLPLFVIICRCRPARNKRTCFGGQPPKQVLSFSLLFQPPAWILSRRTRSPGLISKSSYWALSSFSSLTQTAAFLIFFSFSRSLTVVPSGYSASLLL